LLGGLRALLPGWIHFPASWNYKCFQAKNDNGETVRPIKYLICLDYLERWH